MSPKLPVISGEEFVKAAGKIGYVAVRQKGSHVRLRHPSDPQRKPLSVPQHKTLKRGLLKQFLRDANVSVEQLIELL
jgi:predicted RNA binding protein YcfA (HicA-like mRNA interferase family)